MKVSRLVATNHSRPAVEHFASRVRFCSTVRQTNIMVPHLFCNRTSLSVPPRPRFAASCPSSSRIYPPAPPPDTHTKPPALGHTTSRSPPRILCPAAVQFKLIFISACNGAEGCGTEQRARANFHGGLIATHMMGRHSGIWQGAWKSTLWQWGPASSPKPKYPEIHFPPFLPFPTRSCSFWVHRYGMCAF